MSTIASAMARLTAAERSELQVAFVTTDPARDTRPALRTYLDRFDPDFVGVTGPLERIDALAKPMDIFIKKGEKLPSGGYEVRPRHRRRVGPQGRRRPRLDRRAPRPSDMAEDLRRS